MYRKSFFTIAISLLILSCNSTGKKMNKEIIKQEALDTLRNVLQEQQEWVKVHAAEFLIWSGNPEGVKEVYLKEQEQFIDKSQYRIGIWRVLAQLSNGGEKENYQQQILRAFLDTVGKDRIHAIETMAKLKRSPLPEYSDITQQALQSDIKSLSAYTQWSIAYTNEDSMQRAKAYFLERVLDYNEEEVPRRIAAYVLRNSGTLNDSEWAAFGAMVLQLPADAPVRLSFANAALTTAPETLQNPEVFKKLQDVFYGYSGNVNKGVRIDMAAGLAAWGTEKDLPLLQNWLRNVSPTGVAADDADVQASAGYAILQIINR